MNAKKMKKVSLLIILALTVGLFAGCGGGGNSAGPLKDDGSVVLRIRSMQSRHLWIPDTATALTASVREA